MARLPPVPVPSPARWLPLVMASVLAGGMAAVYSAGGALQDAPPPRLEISLAASRSGTLQVFYDRGLGTSTNDSATTPIRASAQPIVYALPLPLGSIKLLRIDPNDRAGTYVFGAVRIRNGAGEVVAEIPVEKLQPALQTAVASNAARGLVVTTPADATDPQLVYTPEAPIRLSRATLSLGAVVFRFLSVAAVSLLLLLGLGRLRGLHTWLGAVAAWCTRCPNAAVALAGLAGALLATYPLLLGYSLVSPNNGGALMLYEQAPFVPGSSDVEIEDARGTDVGAMMWAILPYTVVQRQAIAAGEAPLWNRYNGIGEPLWGQAQTYALDPFHLLSLAIPDPALAMDLRFIVARAAFAIGAGVSVLVATRSWPAGVLIALIAPFVGHFVYRFNHPAYFSIVYAPWILVAYGWLAKATDSRGRARAAMWLAAASALHLVGSTPKEGLVALVGVHLCGLVAILSARGTWSDRAGRLDWACIAGAGMVLITAPHWLLFLDTLSRSYTLYDTPAVQLADWGHMVGFVLGGAAPGMPTTGVHPAVAALAILAVFTVRTIGALARGALAGTIIFVAIACGIVPAAVLMKVPFVGSIYQIDNAFLGATIPPLLLLAGAGAARLFDARPGHRPWLAISALVLLCAVVLQGVPGSPFQLATLIAIGSLLGALGVVLVATVFTTQSAAVAIVALLMAGGASAAAGGLHVMDAGLPAADRLLLQPRPRAPLGRSPALDAMRARTPEPFRAAPVESVLFPGTQAYWGVEGIGGPDALRLPYVETLLDTAGIERTSWRWRIVLHAEALPGARGLLDMLNVRYLVRPRETQADADEAQEPVRIEERLSAWPRAFFVDGVERHAGPLAFSSRLATANNPFASVDEADAEAASAVQQLPTAVTEVVPAFDYDLTPNTTSFTVRTEAAGLAVLSEAYVQQDFRATVNGVPAPYIRVNHALKGVVIPAAGTWTVRFDYVPAMWNVSWALAAIGMAGLFAASWFARSAGRARQRRESV